MTATLAKSEERTGLTTPLPATATAAEIESRIAALRARRRELETSAAALAERQSEQRTALGVAVAGGDNATANTIKQDLGAIAIDLEGHTAAAALIDAQIAGATEPLRQARGREAVKAFAEYEKEFFAARSEFGEALRDWWETIGRPLYQRMATAQREGDSLNNRIWGQTGSSVSHHPIGARKQSDPEPWGGLGTAFNANAHTGVDLTAIAAYFDGTEKKLAQALPRVKA